MEIDYKKKYKDALKIMEQVQKGLTKDSWVQAKITEAFTELAESEDEKIRKELINFVEEFFNGLSTVSGKGFGEKNRYISWLEKRKKEEPSIADIVDEHYWEMLGDDKDQKPVEWKQENVEELTDFENAMMHIGGSFFGSKAGLDPNNTDVVKEQANLLLTLIPKQEWSEEDEIHLRDVIYAADNIYTDKCGKEELIAWLKSLKDKVQLQPKQWKPSEEQIEAIETAIRTWENSLRGSGLVGTTLPRLKDLLADLKAL